MAKKDKKYKLIEIVKFIWTYVRKHRGLFCLIIGLTLFTSIVESISPYIYGQVIDSFLGKTVIFGLNIPSLLFFWSCFVIISIFVQRIISRMIVWLEVAVERNFVKDIVSNVLYLPIKFFYDQKPGEVFKKIDRGSNSMVMILESFLFSSASQILRIFVSLIIMFSLDWRLSLINCITIIIFFAFAINFHMKKILEIRKKVNNKYNEIFGNIGDFLANIFTVKTNANEKFEIAKVDKDYAKAMTLTTESMRLWTHVSLGQGLISWSGILITVILGAYFLSQNIISAGDFVSFLLYLDIIYRPLWQLTNQYRGMKKMIVDVGDAQEMLNESHEKQLARETENMVIKGEIEFKNVSFKYPEREQGILQKVNFRVSAGQTLAIFGETGSGKTTIYNLLLRLYDPDSGKILFDGITMNKISRQTLRSQIAVVPQDPSLFNESILDNIKYGKNNATMDEVIKAAQIANAHKFITELPKGYKTKVGDRGVKLSGGQVQRIAIARAALRDPKILILDEATSSLDQKTKFEVLDALKHLIVGRTTIIITHDFSAITQNADHIIVIDEGNIIEKGTHQQLSNKPGIYQQLWESQQKHLK